jgi:Tfp pilus assembly protein PilF
MAYGHLRSHTEALSDFNKAIEMEPDHPGGYSRRAWIYLILAIHSEAADDYSTLIALAPDNPY